MRTRDGAPRWGDPARWHVTLVFLGAVPGERVPALLDAVAPVVTATPRLALRLAGAGTFGGRRGPEVAWAGVGGDVGALTGLAGRLAAAVGSTDDRPYRPHVTLGRWRAGQPADAGVLAPLAGWAGAGWPVDHVHLVRSTPGAAARHERVAGWPLAG